MFGETESESPRMPSPWEAIASSVPSPTPSPLALSSSTTSLTNSSGAPSPGDQSSPSLGGAPTMKYLDAATSSGASESFSTIELKLAPEIEEGNVEYKLRLIAPSPSRFTRLVTQLKYRLLEGGGQALYEIGVSDDGELVGLTRADLDASLDTLERMAGELGATMIVLKEIELPEGAVGAKQFVLPKPQPIVKVKGQQRMSDAVRSKKERDREARRKRRAAALLVGESELSEQQRETNDSDDEAMSKTVTLVRPTSLECLTPPMPIIKPYPYGRKPFGMARGNHKSTLSTEKVLDHTSSSLSSISSIKDDFDYAPSASLPNLNLKSKLTSVDDEDEVDPVFGFDLSISSMSLSDSPEVPRTKPLHFTSVTSDSSPTLDNVPAKPKHARKKPIIPLAPIMTPAEKAAERRLKRDARREEKRHTVNAPEAAPPHPPKPIVIRPPTPPPPPPPQTHADEGPKLIAEALVVRKLALEEAFLDFGGFGLADDMVSDLSGTRTSSDGGFGTGISDSDNYLT